MLGAALGRYGWGERLLEEAPSPADAVPSLPSTLLPGVGNFFSFTFATLANTVFALFVGLFFAVNPKLYTAGLVRLFPPKHRPRAGVVVERVGTTLRAWLLGQLVAMLSAGTLTTLGLLILGTPSALALGFLAGLFEFIPTIGALLPPFPPFCWLLPTAPLQALYVAIVFFVVQQIQSNIIMPLVYQRAVSLPPAADPERHSADGGTFRLSRSLGGDAARRGRHSTGEVALPRGHPRETG